MGAYTGRSGSYTLWARSSAVHRYKGHGQVCLEFSVHGKPRNDVALAARSGLQRGRAAGIPPQSRVARVPPAACGRQRVPGPLARSRAGTGRTADLSLPAGQVCPRRRRSAGARGSRRGRQAPGSAGSRRPIPVFTQAAPAPRVPTGRPLHVPADGSPPPAPWEASSRPEAARAGRDWRAHLSGGRAARVTPASGDRGAAAGGPPPGSAPAACARASPGLRPPRRADRQPDLPSAAAVLARRRGDRAHGWRSRVLSRPSEGVTCCESCPSLAVAPKTGLLQARCRSPSPDPWGRGGEGVFEGCRVGRRSVP